MEKDNLLELFDQIKESRKEVSEIKKQLNQLVLLKDTMSEEEFNSKFEKLKKEAQIIEEQKENYGKRLKSLGNFE